MVFVLLLLFLLFEFCVFYFICHFIFIFGELSLNKPIFFFLCFLFYLDSTFCIIVF